MRKLLLKTMLLLCALIVGSGTMWADTYTMSMDSGTKNGTKDVHWTSNNATLTHSNVSWSASFSGGSITNSNNYVQIGSKNSPFTTITLSTSDISGTITEVKVGCGAYNSNATVAVTVGGNAFGGNAQTVGAAPSSSGPCDQKTFTGSASGAIVITITNGTNGRAGYIDYVSVTYTTGGTPTAASTTTTISATGITNKDVYAGTAAGSLSASVTSGGNAVQGATVTWSGNNDDVATINASGVVTLVGAGTVTFTASYAGVTNQYQSSSATYELTVTDSTPFAGGDVTFTGGTDVGSTSGNNSADEISKSGVTISSTDAAFATAQYRLYSGSTTTFSTSTGTITKIVFTKNGSYDLSKLSTATGSYDSSIGTWTGNATSVSFSAAAQVRLDEIVVTVTPDGTVSAPSITGTTPFLNSTTVTITAEDGADIYYTTDGSTPSTSSTHYSAPFTIDATTTVKAIAVKDNTNSDTAEQTFTKVTPINVATALNTADNTEVYVEGIVTRVTGLYSYSLTYFISDNGTENDELEIFNGKGLDGANFSNTNDLQAGDVVVVHGTLTTYNNQKELSSGSRLVSLTTKADPELSYATTEYTVYLGESFTAPTLTNPNNLTVTYSVSTNDNVASVDASTGAVTVGSNAGTVTITASFAGDATYRAGSASYTLTVKEPNIITLAAGATVTTTSFPSFSGSGYKTLDDYQIVLSSDNAKDWSVIDCMKSGADLQMKASTGTLVSPAIRTPYGYTVTVNYTSDEAMTLSSGTDTETGANGSVSLDVQSTNAAFTLQTGNKFATVQSITITAKAIATITLNAACTDGSMVYGTYSNSSAFVVSDDIVVAEIGFDSNNRLNVVEYATGEVVPANTGVMVSALAGGDYTVTLSSEAGTSKLGTNNRLRPTGGNGITASEMSTADANCLFYRLTMHKGTEIGFWWGAEGGAAFGLAANKAYLAVPSGQASRVMGFSFDSISTSVNGVGTVLDMNAPVYNVLGQRVSPSTKGILIQNGKKFINK